MSSRRQRDETTVWCEACKCQIQTANIIQHENGRRHRSNLAENYGNTYHDDVGSESRSRSTSEDYQQTYNYQGNNTMMMNTVDLTGGRNQQQQQQQQQQRPQRNYPTTMNPSTQHNNNNNMLMASQQHHFLQQNYLAPLYPTNPGNSQFSNMMMMNPQQMYQQPQYIQHQQQHQQQNFMNNNNHNNNNKNRSRNNANDDDDDDYEDDDQGLVFCDATGKYRVNGSTGGNLSLLCPKCSRLSTPQECAQRQQCPGCSNDIVHLKHVYVSSSTIHPSKSKLAVAGSKQYSNGSSLSNNNVNAGSNAPRFTWSCPKCTFINADSSNICLMCNGLKDGSGFFVAAPTNSSGSNKNNNNNNASYEHNGNLKEKGVIYVDDDDDQCGNHSNNNNAAAIAPSRFATVARANAQDMFNLVGNTNNPSAAVMSRATSVRNTQNGNNNSSNNSNSMMMMNVMMKPGNNNGGNLPQVKQEVKQDVNAIFAEMDESDSLRCVFCLQSNATHRFMPCEHVILCSACSVEVAAKFRGATDNDISLETQNKSNSHYKSDPQILRCFYCRQLSKNLEAAPIPQKWRAPPHSTFPWIGGDQRNFEKFTEEIKAAGRSFIYKQCRPRFASDEDYSKNVRIDDCHWVTALDKFKKGWIAARCPEGAWSGVFGFHGTERKHAQDKSLWNIAKHNFDPSRRSRNNHGPGEYFSIHFSQSLEYAKGTNTLILSFLLRGPQTTMVEDFCYVVNNPVSDLSTNYCLPLFLVYFQHHVPRWCVPRFPYMRWIFKWENDEESDFIAYDHGVNQEMNEGMCRSFARRGQIQNRNNNNNNNNNKGNDDSSGDDEGEASANPNSIIVTCFNMETEEDNDYEIDFDCYTQTNVETKFMRKIQPTCVPALAFPKTLWMMCAKNSGDKHPTISDFWMICDMYAQRSLCDAYYTYQKTKKAVADQQQEQQQQQGSSNRGGRGGGGRGRGRGNNNNNNQALPLLSVTHLFDITIFEKKYQVNMMTFRAAYISSTNRQVTEVEYPLAIVDS